MRICEVIGPALKRLAAAPRGGLLPRRSIRPRDRRSSAGGRRGDRPAAPRGRASRSAALLRVAAWATVAVSWTPSRSSAIVPGRRTISTAGSETPGAIVASVSAVCASRTSRATKPTCASAAPARAAATAPAFGGDVRRIDDGDDERVLLERDAQRGGQAAVDARRHRVMDLGEAASRCSMRDLVRADCCRRRRVASARRAASARRFGGRARALRRGRHRAPQPRRRAQGSGTGTESVMVVVSAGGRRPLDALLGAVSSSCRSAGETVGGAVSRAPNGPSGAALSRPRLQPLRRRPGRYPARSSQPCR